MSQPNASPGPSRPIITLTIRWLPLAENEMPAQQKIVLGVTLADSEGTTTAPLLQVTTAAELGELPSALLVQLVERAAGTLPVQLRKLQSQKNQAFTARATPVNSSHPINAPTTASTGGNSDSDADESTQLKLFQS
jgi:hypothetical protein